MTDMNPVDRRAVPQRFGQPVETVPHHAEYALHAGLYQGFGDEVGDIVDLHYATPSMSGHGWHAGPSSAGLLSQQMNNLSAGPGCSRPLASGFEQWCREE